jgi:hypothetical protein
LEGIGIVGNAVTDDAEAILREVHRSFVFKALRIERLCVE